MIKESGTVRGATQPRSGALQYGRDGASRPEFKIMSRVAREEWNRGVSELEGCCFHSYEWSQYTSEKNGASPLYFRWRDMTGGTRSMVVALRSEKRVGGIRLIDSLSLGSLPAARRVEEVSESVSDILGYCRGNGIGAFSVNTFGTPLGSEVLVELGFRVTRRWEFLLDISEDEESLWKRLHSKKRNLIRKGLREKLKIVNGSEVRQVLHFRDLATETWERKARCGIDFPRVGDERFYLTLKERILDKGLGKLYLAYDGDQPVAGAVFAVFNGKVYYMLSSASRTGLEKAAPDLILWTAIRDCQREGHRLLNLGGVSEGELGGKPLEESGLYHFKSRFSADAHCCYKGLIVLQSGRFGFCEFVEGIKSRLFLGASLLKRHGKKELIRRGSV
jgi:hypothetical protein